MQHKHTHQKPVKYTDAVSVLAEDTASGYSEPISRVVSDMRPQADSGMRLFILTALKFLPPWQ